MGAQGFLCSCPHKFQGSKCQTPVVACSTGLWCANGGMCVFSEEANATICKCPSTHTGASCQTLVEAQDFGPSEQLRTNFTSPLVIPSNSTLDLIVDERDKYFHTFFALLGALVFVWVVSLCFVYHSRERRRSSRAIAVVGNKQHVSGRDFGPAEGPVVYTSSSSSAVLSSVPVRRNPSSGISGSSSSNNIAVSIAMGNAAGSIGSRYVPPEITRDMGNGSGGDSIGEHRDATDVEVAALFAVPSMEQNILSGLDQSLRGSMQNHSGQFGMPNQAGQFGMPNQAGQFGMPNQAGQFGMPNQAVQFGMANQSGQFGMASLNGHSGVAEPARHLGLGEPTRLSGSPDPAKQRAMSVQMEAWGSSAQRSAPPVAAPPLADGQLTQVPLDNPASQERAAKDQQLHATETSLRTKEEELRRMQEAVEKRVAQQVTRVEQEAKKLEQLRKELETIEDPTKKEVADLRKRIELVDRELRPMRALVERKEKELKDATTAYNNKNAQKSELVGKLFEIVTESERQRLAKLEEITSLLTQMERKEGGQ
ncbi:unnamed protein product [Closterium sp. Yama58-4]|nr:unnamed protein product [Closterium sp. Yama58-4]